MNNLNILRSDNSLWWTSKDCWTHLFRIKSWQEIMLQKKKWMKLPLFHQVLFFLQLNIQSENFKFNRKTLCNKWRWECLLAIANRVNRFRDTLYRTQAYQIKLKWIKHRCTIIKDLRGFLRWSLKNLQWHRCAHKLLIQNTLLLLWKLNKWTIILT